MDYSAFGKIAEIDGRRGIFVEFSEKFPALSESARFFLIIP
jgi:hypothetical protein